MPDGLSLGSCRALGGEFAEYEQFSKLSRPLP
jgi:hypothetical protein